MNAVQIIEGKYPSGRPRWMVQAFVGGKRIRRYFSAEDAALAEQNRIERSSLEALEISERILHEAYDCHLDLQKHGWTLRRATDYVLENVIRYQDQQTISNLVQTYMAEERASGIAADTIRDLRSRLAKLTRRFGDKKPYEVTTDNIRLWLSDMTDIEGLSPLSRRHYLSKASQFFRWCLANKRCIENPVAVVKRPKVIPSEIEFYTVAQCKRLLELASEYTLYHYVVLGMYPGIRPTELRRLNQEHVKLDRRMITLTANVTKKTRRRFVEMPVGDPFGDCLFAWLSELPLQGPVFSGSHSTFVRRFREFRDILGFDWIQDGLRHTAATYHFALYGDAAKTATLLGERDIRTLLEHYKGLATKADAEAFYAMRPSNPTAILRRLESAEGTPTSDL